MTKIFSKKIFFSKMCPSAGRPHPVIFFTTMATKNTAPPKNTQYTYRVKPHCLAPKLQISALTDNFQCVSTTRTGNNYGHKWKLFFITKKHTTLTIPVWSPTTVLGKPNPA